MTAQRHAEIFALVQNNIYEVLPDVEGREIKPGDRLTDLGANSVDRAEIVMLAMEALSLHIQRVELSGVKNVGELVDALYAKSHGQ
ncbi:acyl carrier protein [Streptomyces prunicolor]|jgi:polyketide biosynthesis acyl carrier protein|uniref:acyl carrier protein n=1 Tax=Streptomyces prunicolor TaxID=67348 RepID=UPI00037A55A3|nr:acyl carrier protein [Streptomyces prunicolor]